MSFLDHLEQLRWHIIRALASILVFTIIAFLARGFFFETLILGPGKVDFWTYQRLCDLGRLINSEVLCIEKLPFILQSRTLTGQFTAHITYSIVIGIILAFPYTFWELWRFIAPGLNISERRVTRGAVFFVTLLFAMGILFGYYVIAPLSINFLSNYQLAESIQNEFDISSYVGSVCMIVLSAGIMFQLPMVVLFLTKVGVATPALLKHYRRHAVVIILIVSAILTPPDVISQCLISMPLFILYEVSIFISGAVLKRQEKQLAKSKKENE
ncbi:twin-arginine translocase subunit TatC [Roseivirga sp. BDSF3-8]|uniref:twin-arginine translocase subunit TatC n=1 Tax=Roseivirga sp. BDSF3-8 TaxID=3241598 RepID=UPI0035319ABB